MRRLRAWVHRLLSTFAGVGAERDLSDEYESHLQFQIDDNVRAGMAPAEARRQALLATGSPDAAKEAYRDRRGLPSLDSLLRDLRHAARTLGRTPGFTAAGIVILGLGIGANSAIFMVVDAVVIRPLRFSGTDRIVRLWHTPPQAAFPGMRRFSLSPANFLDWQAQSRAFEAMAMQRGGIRTVTGRGEPEAVVIQRVSASFLPIFGLTPVAGRHFSAADDRSDAAPTVILSEPYWRSRFGADPGAIGQTLLLDRQPYTIVGVVPTPSFLDQVKVWMPLAWTAEERAERANHNYRALARLRPGVTVAEAQAELDLVSRRLEAQYPEDNTGWGALVVPLHDDLVGDARPALLVLLGAVGLVLLIACANLANLLLARTHGRGREIALRAALGGSRLRIVQQLLAEGVLLGLGGGAAGLLAAALGVDALVGLFGDALPRIQDVAVDGRILAVATATSLLTGAAAALLPAWRLSGRDVGAALKQGSQRGSAGADGTIRSLLVVSEVALALMLLVGAGLLTRTLANLRAVDPGFDPRNVLTAEIGIPAVKYSTEVQRNQFFDRVRQAAGALPGVEAAAWIDSLPLQGGSTQFMLVEGRPPSSDAELPTAAVRLPSPGYFHVARIPLLAGRDFSEADGFGAPAVAIVSERTAERFWPGEDPIGKHLTLKMLSEEPREVVGVVGEVKMSDLDAGATDSETAVYAPARQFAYAGAVLALRTTVPPASVAQALVAAVHAIDPEQPVLAIQPFEQVVEDSLGQRPTAMWLLAGFSLVALLLASVGIYSVLAFGVRQRAREIGIRLALGASAGTVLRMVILDGLRPTIAGAVAGVLAAAALVRALGSLLYGVSPYDPATFGIVTGAVLAVGVLATAIPAYRASRVDPAMTLRLD
ncbi:MAG: ADOP family duplicated permease [Vicinamibacterales bacterium]